MLGGRASVLRRRRGAGCRGVRPVQRRLVRRRNGVVWRRGSVSGDRWSGLRIRRHRRCIVNRRSRRGLNRSRRCIVNRSLWHHPGSRRCIVNRSLPHHPGSRYRPGSRRGRRCNPGSRRRHRNCRWGRGRGERRRDAPGERGQRNCRPGRQHDHSPATTTKPMCATHRALLLSSSGMADRLPPSPPIRVPTWKRSHAAEGSCSRAPANAVLATERLLPRLILLAERLRFFGIRVDPSLPRHPGLSDTANCEVA